MIIRNFFKKKRAPATEAAQKRKIHEKIHKKTHKQLHEKPVKPTVQKHPNRQKEHKPPTSHKQHRTSAVHTTTPHKTPSPSMPFEKYERTLSALNTQLSQLSQLSQLTQLTQLISSIKQDHQNNQAQQADAATAIHAHLTEINTDLNHHLQRIASRQKEVTIQLDEITGILQDNGADTRTIAPSIAPSLASSNTPSNTSSDVRLLLDALIVCSAEIEHFYRFTAHNTDSPLYEQAKMMWHATKTAGESAAVSMINDSSVPFDIKRHQTESCECDLTVPNGYVLRTLKCGFIYKDEVIRRAMVVVNKWENNGRTGYDHRY